MSKRPPQSGSNSRVGVRAPAKSGVLVVFPARNDPTSTQLEVYARAINGELYDARLRCREPLPRIVRHGPSAELEGLAGELRSVGFSCHVLDANAIMGSFDYYRVTGIKAPNGVLHLTRREVRGDTVTALDGELALDLSQRALLVLGRYEFSAQGRSKVDELSVSVGVGGVSVEHTTGSTKAESHDMVHFAHLYFEGSNMPHEFCEQDIVNYEFLGPKKTVVGRQNFKQVMDWISSGPGVAKTDLLFQHAGRIKDSFTQVTGGGDGAGASWNVSQQSSEAAAGRLSRVLYYDWLATLTDKPRRPSGRQPSGSRKQQRPPKKKSRPSGRQPRPTGKKSRPPSGRQRPPTGKQRPPTAKQPPGDMEFLDRRPTGKLGPETLPDLNAIDDDLVFLDSVDPDDPAPALDPSGAATLLEEDGFRPDPGPEPGRPSGVGRGAPPLTAERRKGEGWERRERTAEDDMATLTSFHELAAPPPETDPYLNKELGAFSVEKFLWVDRGERAYISTDLETRERALLRVYPLKGSYAAETRRLIERGERTCRVESPALSLCFGTGKTKECFFVAHELPMGETLAELLEAGEVFDEDAIRQLLEQTAKGLSALHSRQLSHGHVSPHTIRRERPGSWVLCDAGLGRSRPEFSFLAVDGEVLGAPGYIAPETVDSGTSEPSADLYSLGCVAWTLVMTYGAPFEGDDAVQILLDQLNNEVPPALAPEGVRSVSQGLTTIVGKLSGYTPTVRYRTSKDLVADLRARQVQPFPPEVVEETAGPAREPSPINAGTLLLVLLALLDIAIAVSMVGLYMKAQTIEVQDPLEGYNLPLPGVSEGGYEPLEEGKKTGKTGKTSKTGKTTKTEDQKTSP